MIVPVIIPSHYDKKEILPLTPEKERSEAYSSLEKMEQATLSAWVIVDFFLCMLSGCIWELKWWSFLIMFIVLLLAGILYMGYWSNRTIKDIEKRYQEEVARQKGSH
jgi:hypothetical protein